MSYFLADATGPLEDFASIGGYADFREWALNKPGAIRKFAQLGFTEHLEELAESLDDVTVDALVREQVSLLKKYAKTAQNVLIVSDGMSDDEEIRGLGGKASENALHRAADSQFGKMHVAIRFGFAAGRSVVDRSKALRGATTSKEVDDLLRDVPEAIESALLDVLPKTLLQAFTAGGEVGIELLRSRPRDLYALSAHDALEVGRFLAPFRMKFDSKSPRAIEWARKHAAELAKGISDTTREDIARAVVSILEGEKLGEAYESILNAVGSPDRAELIARHEVMVASNEGQRESWNQAVEGGLLDKTSRRAWIATDDACEDCQALDGVEVGLEEEYPEEGVDGPPLHPRCRCTEGIVA